VCDEFGLPTRFRPDENLRAGPDGNGTGRGDGLAIPVEQDRDRSSFRHFWLRIERDDVSHEEESQRRAIAGRNEGNEADPLVLSEPAVPRKNDRAAGHEAVERECTAWRDVREKGRHPITRLDPAHGGVARSTDGLTAGRDDFHPMRAGGMGVDNMCFAVRHLSRR